MTPERTARTGRQAAGGDGRAAPSKDGAARALRLGSLVGGLVVLAGCTSAPPPPAPAGREPVPVPPIEPRQPEFGASHHAVVEGVVTSRGGQPLDSVEVVAWRLTRPSGLLAQDRVVTDPAGRFRLPVRATVGPQPTSVQDQVVVRAFAYASRYPRGEQGRVALDSATVAVTLVPLSQAPTVVRTRITLPLP